MIAADIQAPPPHLFVARLWFEGNRFSARPTDAAAFARREDRRGPAALAGQADTASELAAVIEFAATHPAWQLTVSRCASAEPGGPIDGDWFRHFVTDTVADLVAARPSHIYLSLHGAAIIDDSDSPELDWLRAIRKVAPVTPLAVSFDLHGNIDPAIVGLIDFGTAYRCHPHTDMRETAARALAWLATPRHLVGAVAKLGRLLPSFNMLTADGPMADLEALARAAEQQPGIVDVSVFGGFPYADTPMADAAVMVWAEAGGAKTNEPPDEPTSSPTTRQAIDLARSRPQVVAAALVDAIRERLPRFEPALPDADAGLRIAARQLDQSPGLVAVTDPGDNPLSGGQGTSTTLLRAVLAARQASAVLAALPAGAIVFAAMTDAALVTAARRAGSGAMLDLILGHGTPEAFGGPLPLTARIVRFTEGRFVNTGPMERGRAVDCAGSVVLDHAGVRIIVTAAVCPANDPAFLALHGIDLDQVRLLCVKAKNHFRAAFAARCLAIIDVDCPGPAAARLSLLPMRHWTGQGEPIQRRRS